MKTKERETQSARFWGHDFRNEIGEQLLAKHNELYHQVTPYSMSTTFDVLREEFEEINKAFKSPPRAVIAIPAKSLSAAHARPMLTPISALDAYRDIEAQIATKPRSAAKNTLLLIENWLDRDDIQTAETFISLLEKLSITWNLKSCYAVDVIVAALIATRPRKGEFRTREALIRHTLKRTKWFVGSGAVKSAIHKLS